MKKGTRHTEETLSKISESLMGHSSWNKGLPKEMQPRFGKKHSIEARRKIGEASKGRNLGEKSSNWKGKEKPI